MINVSSFKIVSPDNNDKFNTVKIIDVIEKNKKHYLVYQQSVGTDTETSDKLTEITFYGKSFEVKAKSISGQGEYYKGRISNMSKNKGGGDQRLKAYFADNHNKKVDLGTETNFKNEFIGEFAIETIAPYNYYLKADGTVEEV